MATSAVAFKGDKLVGRSNITEWLTNARLFLEINGFMPYIDGSEEAPLKSLYYQGAAPKSAELGVKYAEREIEYNRNNKKALGALKSIISLENYERFKNKNTAKDLWDSIIATFGESSFELVGRYIDRIINANYSSFKSMDEYTSQIQSSAIYLTEMKNEVPKPILAWLIIKGLSSSFDPFISRKYEDLGRDLKSGNMDISKLISDLIAEEARLKSNIDYEANKVSNSYKNKNKKPFCKNCKRSGHLEDKCWEKYPELRNNSKNKDKDKKSNKTEKSNKSSESKVVMTTLKTKPKLDVILATLNKSFNKDNPNKIILDSGASEHYTPNRDWLLNYTEYNNTDNYITVANGDKMPIIGTGDIPLIINGINILMTKVFYIPGLKSTLISAKQLADKGWSITFNKEKAFINYINNSREKLDLSAKWIFNAYYLKLKVNYQLLEPVLYKVDQYNDLDLLHKRLVHINKDYIVKTYNEINPEGNNIKNIKDSELTNCDPCQYAKFKELVSRDPLKIPFNCGNLEFFDSDIMGPFKTSGLKGERYIITFTCRVTRLVWLYSIKFKSEAYDKMVELFNLIKNQFNINIKYFMLDNAGEYKSEKWVDFTTQKGIKNLYSTRYIHAQNGISERLNLWLIERLIAIIREKQIPTFLWPNLVQAIIHIKNRTYNSIIKAIPFTIVTNNKPNLDYIRILGSLTYTLDPKDNPLRQQQGKLADKAEKGILVGYESSNSYLVYIPSKKKVIVARDVVIKENLTYNYEDSNISLIKDYDDLVESGDPKGARQPEQSSSNRAREPKQSSSNRARKPESSSSSYPEDSDTEKSDSSIEYLEVDPNFKPRDFEIRINPQKQANQSLTNLDDDIDDDIYFNNNTSVDRLASLAYFTSLNKGDSNLENNNKIDKVIINNSNKTIFKEPKSYIEAINSPEADYWQKAQANEIKSLESQNTWDLVSIKDNPNIKAIKTRWVYKVKYNKDLAEFKARFVAKGFEQLYGLDYIDTFAQVIKQVAWKLIFALALINNWIIYKIDAISAFTQGDIDTSLYIKAPEGFDNYKDYYLRLNKALYGLKQSARIWYSTLKEALLELNFTALNTETCIFINKSTNIILCVYVDDIAVIGPNIELIESFCIALEKYFKIKRLGLIKDYLGIQIERTATTLKLFQTNYIESIIKRFNFDYLKPSSIPMDYKTKLVANPLKASPSEIKWFQQVIGALLYLALATRWDITFAVIKLTRFTSNPSLDHKNAVIKIFRYLIGTKDFGITYTTNPNIDNNLYIKGYCDADYAGDISTAKSTSGFIFLLANGPITWKSKLQSVIAQSSTESEYLAIGLAVKELVYIRELLIELGQYKQNKFPLYSDNNGALLLAKNPVFHDRTKHIATKYHFIRYYIEKGILDLIYIPTKDQLADGFTKPLERIKFNLFKKSIDY
jgi:hypothetical protein